MPNLRDTVVLGASFGGVSALRRLVGALPEDFTASVCVVQHVSAEAGGHLGALLDRAGPLPAATARDGDALVPGRVLVAPPGQHLAIVGERVRLSRGPRENRARPAVDVLFRSAAASRDGRVVAVQLTGYLDDGVAGLAAVKRCGGVTLAQDPEDADAPSMPQAAIDAGVVDHVAPLAGLPALLQRLVGEPAASVEVPATLRREVEISLGSLTPTREVQGEMVPFVCHDCGGPLWQVEGSDVMRFRCHTGHAMSARHVAAAQDEDTERALWVAVRTLEERARMVRDLAERSRARSNPRTADAFEQRAEESERHAISLRRLLQPEAARRGGAPEAQGPAEEGDAPPASRSAAQTPTPAALLDAAEERERDA